jgi:hypothetical protein
MKKPFRSARAADPSRLDTSPAAAEMQARIQERLGGAGRLRLAYEMSVSARALMLAGLQARRPDTR